MGNVVYTCRRRPADGATYTVTAVRGDPADLYDGASPRRRGEADGMEEDSGSDEAGEAEHSVYELPGGSRKPAQRQQLAIVTNPLYDHPVCDSAGDEGQATGDQTELSTSEASPSGVSRATEGGSVDAAAAAAAAAAACLERVRAEAELAAKLSTSAGRDASGMPDPVQL